MFLARIVMPRSFSMAFESIARSGSWKRASSVLDWRSSLSTSVVLPWSTWAMIAIFRSLEVALEGSRGVRSFMGEAGGTKGRGL